MFLSLTESFWVAWIFKEEEEEEKEEDRRRRWKKRRGRKKRRKKKEKGRGRHMNWFGWVGRWGRIWEDLGDEGEMIKKRYMKFSKN